jgi:septal ring factor EnvC (AmiA/AmiB activator)
MTFKSALSATGKGLVNAAVVVNNVSVSNQISEIDDQIEELETKLTELREKRAQLENRKYDNR